MTFLAINWLSISIDLLLVIFVIVCILMTLVILMQRPKQEGLGAAFGGGVTDQVFGARTTNVLQRGTVYLGSLFFILSLLLAVLIGQQNKVNKVTTDADFVTAPTEAPVVAPAMETAPKSLTEELPVEVTPAEETPAPTEVPADAPTETTPPVEAAPPSETAPTEETLPPADAATPPAEGTPTEESAAPAESAPADGN